MKQHTVRGKSQVQNTVIQKEISNRDTQGKQRKNSTFHCNLLHINSKFKLLNPRNVIYIIYKVIKITRQPTSFSVQEIHRLQLNYSSNLRELKQSLFCEIERLVLRQGLFKKIVSQE